MNNEIGGEELHRNVIKPFVPSGFLYNPFKKFLHFFEFTSVKYFSVVFIVSIVSLILYYLHINVGYQFVSLIFLLMISLLPLLNFRPGQIFLAAVMSAFIWNYYFIPPYYTLRIGKVEDALMFGMYFINASVSGLLISRIRAQQQLINNKEKKTSALYNLAKELSSAKSMSDAVRYSVLQIKNTFNAEVVFFLMENGTLIKNSMSTIDADETAFQVAQIVYSNSQKAGRFTNNMPITEITFYPLSTKSGKLGVVGLLFEDRTQINPESESLLDTFLVQIAIAVEREQLKELAKHHLILIESEKLYKILFDSISHELKTPITTIIGAASSFRDERIIQNKEVFFGLQREIMIASERLNRLVENLLDITRLETGNLKLKKEWHSLADLLNSVIERITPEIKDQHINLTFQNEMGLILIDYALIEQVIINIIHNAIEYNTGDGIIDIYAKKTTEGSIISIADNGKGIPENAIENIFNKFFRVPGTKAGGIGLGLSIAKGFIEAHGGTIKAKNRKTGGAEFIIFFPQKD